MKIESISYERLLSDRAYGNRRLQATARIEEGETPASASAALRAFVGEQLIADVRAEEEREAAERARRRAEFERQRRETLDALAQRHADDTDEERPELDDMPFDADDEEV